MGTRFKENQGRNPKRVPEHTLWARTMFQPMHPYCAILNLNIIYFRNTEKLIDEWVVALKIVELSMEGFVKIGWDNTPKDTKVNILAGDLKRQCRTARKAYQDTLYWRWILRSE
ncbi:UNVERIFIED_CONTAM: hypothetical protein Sradi_3309400 [Sesamum radiatum]|uniref:Uncharacterized protein n=1 Tax=Sesamum radiatum TaxID=300843 RepID=A0AAW2R1I4_SESRA